MATSPRNVERLPHDRSSLLYSTDGGGGPSGMLLDSIDRWTGAMLADDVANDRIEGGFIVGRVISKQSGVVAGRFAVNRMMERCFQSCIASWSVEEGQMVSEGDLILSIEGPSEGVLRCERVMLNIIGRMSGIATETSEWLSSSQGFPVACTRKTEWGLLDKWAVHVGGGLTHRLNREDALMIKENDLAVLETEVPDESSVVAIAVNKVDFDKEASFCTVEVSDTKQAIEAAKAWSECQNRRSGKERIVLLLDNMGPSRCSETAMELNREGLRDWCILEGSGGIEREALGEWVTQSEVDLVSTSAVNMGVAPLDISMIVGGE
ncbi:MAG: hypothetical protein VX492_05550 [Candidatus Thermoplasmatota archaeon]|nr:hypothetical protein [Candidatus Thermoplasmatota archaeon]